ncbi:MAG: hypothetical protein KDC85_00365 [Saprospiraceae bacterium]|nr:hypothetical protein [Saprospiraceae bacterium]MCB9325426.1 hypothetical protein [Lewinellaceae bacterium]
MTNKLLLLIGLALFSCKRKEVTSTNDTAETDPITETIQPDTIATPAGFQKIGEATGDLDKDGQEEKVMVFNTDRMTDFGYEREIHVFKKEEGAWKLWQRSSTAVLPSEQGGTMGDPFEDISIENGAIVIKHLGGSRQKWSYTHRFRFQNSKWELIGASVEFGSRCDYWEYFDYNLSTGKINYKKETEICDEVTNEMKTTVTAEESFTFKLKKLPVMDGFRPGETGVMTPESEETIYY